MKNKILWAKNLQKVGIFFHLRPYLYIILEEIKGVKEVKGVKGIKKLLGVSDQKKRVENFQLSTLN